MDEEYAKYLLDKTQEDYSRIAEHFSKTRNYVWQELEYFKKFVKDGDKILDLGCGNGRLLDFLKEKNVKYVGVDNSEKLIEIAKNNQQSTLKTASPTGQATNNQQFGIRNPDFIVGDALDLPFENNSFDKIFSIAVFHHIPSKRFRLQFLKETKRVLKPKGLLLLTVWNLWNTKCSIFQIEHLIWKLAGRSKLDFKDIFYPWKNENGKVLVQRYIHCFTKGELKRLAKTAGFKIKETGFLGVKSREDHAPLRGKNKRNIYLVLEKNF